MSRKKARDTAFKCVYQIQFDLGIDIEDLITNNIVEDSNNEEECEYIKEVVIGIKENMEVIDKVILSKIKGWTIDRIAKIDLAILRLATYEIMYIKDLSNKVSANEAVELAKTYGDDNSAKFINGIIASVITDNLKE